MSRWKPLLPLFCLLAVACGGDSKDIRIVSLSTTHSETLVELGAEEKIIAVDMYVELNGLKDIQRIDSFTVTSEEVISLRPTHVIMAFPNEKLKNVLEKNSIDSLFLPPANNLDEVYSQIVSVSRIIGEEKKAEKLISQMKEDAENLLKEIKPSEKRIYHELGYAYGIYSANENSLIGSFYKILGYKNIVSGIPSKNEDGYPQVIEELIIKKNPEIIIVGHRETLRNEIDNRPSWKNISAVKEGKIVYLDENLANNWGVSSVELLQTIAIETGLIIPKQEASVGIKIWQLYIVVILVLVLIMRRKGIKGKI